jgi:aldehyde:ferredoxin oxidoreductase
MTVRGGCWPHILRIDLSQKSVPREALPPEEDLRKYVGGIGLGLLYLLREGPRIGRAADPDLPLNLHERAADGDSRRQLLGRDNR